jgi:hypothetical protein
MKKVTYLCIITSLLTLCGPANVTAQTYDSLYVNEVNGIKEITLVLKRGEVPPEKQIFFNYVVNFKINNTPTTKKHDENGIFYTMPAGESIKEFSYTLPPGATEPWLNFFASTTRPNLFDIQIKIGAIPIDISKK